MRSFWNRHTIAAVLAFVVLDTATTWLVINQGIGYETSYLLSMAIRTAGLAGLCVLKLWYIWALHWAYTAIPKQYTAVASMATFAGMLLCLNNCLVLSGNTGLVEMI